jgi:hypothetical protein
MSEAQARKVAREETMARERQVADAAIARNNNRRTKSNGPKSKISTIPQAQAATIAAAAAAPKLRIPEGFEVIANQKTTKTSRIGNECREREKVQLLKAGLVYGTW